MRYIIRVRFNNKAKYGMLWKAAMEHTRLAELLLFKAPGSYETFTEAFTEFASHLCLAFHLKTFVRLGAQQL